VRQVPPPVPAVRRSARLVPMRQDGLPGPVVPIGEEPILCGRSRGQLKFEDDPAVSPEHARFEFRGEALYAEDLGSLNGTFVRLRGPRQLLAGDEIRVGRQLLRVAPMPRPIEGAGARPWGSADAGYRAQLIQLLDGGGIGEVFPLVLGENTIGREVARVCFPADRFVSSKHARIEVTATGMLLSDVGSSNGTFVRIAAPEPLTSGDQVLVGLQLIRVE
jgi:pSer/pThr/pTyr-binding forkhead associated (FHA) protein